MNILDKAKKITTGDRQKQYGNPKDNYEHIAKVASELLQKELSPKDIVLILIVMKLVREKFKAKRDNQVDIAGYSWVLSKIQDKLDMKKDKPDISDFDNPEVRTVYLEKCGKIRTKVRRKFGEKKKKGRR